MISAVSIVGFAKTLWSSPLARMALKVFGILAIVWIFHAWSVNKGYKKCTDKVAAAKVVEAERQRDEAKKALKKAKSRAQRAELEKATQTEAYKKAIEAARNSPNSDHICLTEEVTNELAKIK